MSIKLGIALGDLIENAPNDRALFKSIIKSQRSLKEEFGEDAFDEAMSELYPFYENSESELFRVYLLNKHLKFNNIDRVEDLAKQFEDDGILVMSETPSLEKGALYKTVLHNQSRTSEAYPIQVSYWRVDSGTSYHAQYSSVEKAIKDESLVGYVEVPEDKLDHLEVNAVESEFRYQSAVKARREKEAEIVM
ncbi:hypothetical protein AB4254_12085 [Vibrio breoganii]